MTLLTESLSLGLDSALCCLALGAAIPSRGTQFILATLFGLCDLAASLLSSLPASHIVAMPPAPLYLGFILARHRRAFVSMPCVGSPHPLEHR